MKTCLIDAELALAIDKLAKAINFEGSTTGHGFRCPECGQALTIHETTPPHFEHMRGHQKCPLSHNNQERSLP
ncbi:MAG TPA: hypothetical protein VH250_05220, partial [Granulicella sp.]|nr:hypothetical protein [Granulicella sp.]